MKQATKKDIADIHQLIQQRKHDLYAFIREHTERIDNHVEVCKTCHERMIGWTRHLPKLRKRMTVELPEATGDSQRLKQLEQLTRGQSLPCGCEVTGVSWTQEQASAEFYRAFAGILEISEDDAKKIFYTIRLYNLPLEIKLLRRLRDKFWLPDGSYLSADLRDAQEGDKVLQLPETVGDFINSILSLHSGTSYNECSEHRCL